MASVIPEVPRRQCFWYAIRTISGSISSSCTQLILAGQLPSNQRHRDQAGGVDVIHELLQRERVLLLSPVSGKQIFDLDLASHVAGAIRGLLQIQMLFGPNQPSVESQPSARRARFGPLGGDVGAPLSDG